MNFMCTLLCPLPPQVPSFFEFNTKNNVISNIYNMTLSGHRKILTVRVDNKFTPRTYHTTSAYR